MVQFAYIGESLACVGFELKLAVDESAIMHECLVSTCSACNESSAGAVCNNILSCSLRVVRFLGEALAAW